MNIFRRWLNWFKSSTTNKKVSGNLPLNIQREKFRGGRKMVHNRSTPDNRCVDCGSTIACCNCSLSNWERALVASTVFDAVTDDVEYKPTRYDTTSNDYAGSSSYSNDSSSSSDCGSSSSSSCD